MKRTIRTEEQIIGILQFEEDQKRSGGSFSRRGEAGAECADLCRKHGVSEGTFYAWKAKYSGMTVSEAKRLKALEEENAKLKRLLAEQMLDMAAMKELLSKKW
jgi:putative transposase